MAVGLMMKILLVILIGVATVHADTCRMTHGKKLRTFGGTLETIKIPCKYNAIKNTVCGTYRITITPGSVIESVTNKRYVVKTMWIALQNIHTGSTWEGRTSLTIANKYLDGSKDAPVNKKGGSLETTDIFNFGSTTVDNEVSLHEKNGEFTITFGLFEPYGSWQQTSGFKFECFSNNFVPTDYPTQICGKGSQGRSLISEMPTAGRATENNCVLTASAMQNTCTTSAERFNASTLCWPIVGERRYHHDCISEYMELPESAMKHCVQYVCSGFTDNNACLALKEEIGDCPQLGDIYALVQNNCPQ